MLLLSDSLMVLLKEPALVFGTAGVEATTTTSKQYTHNEPPTTTAAVEASAAALTTQHGSPRWPHQPWPHHQQP